MAYIFLGDPLPPNPLIREDSRVATRQIGSRLYVVRLATAAPEALQNFPRLGS